MPVGEKSLRSRKLNVKGKGESTASINEITITSEHRDSFRISLLRLAFEIFFLRSGHLTMTEYINSSMNKSVCCRLNVW